MAYKVMTNKDVGRLGIANGGSSRAGKDLEREEVGLNVLERDGWQLVATGTTAITKELVLYFHKAD